MIGAPERIKNKKKNLLVLFLVFPLILMFIVCYDFEVKAPQPMQKSHYKPSEGELSSISIPINISLSEVINELKNIKGKSISDQITVKELPTFLSMQKIEKMGIKKKDKKQTDNKEINTEKVCTKLETNCSQTQIIEKSICKKFIKLPVIEKRICQEEEIVKEIKCIAEENVCVKWENKASINKNDKKSEEDFNNIKKEEIKIIEKLLKVDSTLEYDASISSVDVEANNNALSILVDIDYMVKIIPDFNNIDKKSKIKVNGSASCGYNGTRKKARLIYKAILHTKDGPEITISDISESIDWQNDECKLTAFKFNFNEVLKFTAIQKVVEPIVENTIDKLSKELRLYERLESVLYNVNKSHTIDENLQIITNIEEIQMSPFSGNGQNISVSLFAKVRPKILFSTEMPPLKSYSKDITLSSSGPIFNIRLDSKILYNDARDIILENLKRKENLSFTIDKTDVFASNEKLIVAIEISKPAKGILYFEGTPEYKSEKNAVIVPDINFTKASKNALKIINNNNFQNQILNILKEILVFDIDLKTNQIIKLLSDKIIKIDEESELIIETNGVSNSETWVSSDSIVLALFISGSSNVKILNNNIQ
ncbi:MAG: DUF4403 family protein [Spirochaetia bacterium]|nr:DUF4403 family protein [Spirochaetia bacterium]